MHLISDLRKRRHSPFFFLTITMGLDQGLIKGRTIPIFTIRFIASLVIFICVCGMRGLYAGLTGGASPVSILCWPRCVLPRSLYRPRKCLHIFLTAGEVLAAVLATTSDWFPFSRVFLGWLHKRYSGTFAFRFIGALVKLSDRDCFLRCGAVSG